MTSDKANRNPTGRNGATADRAAPARTGGAAGRAATGGTGGAELSSAGSGKQGLGRLGEEAAARYLAERLGWRILERNWRCSEGELDIVAYDGRRHVVCEVKTRSGVLFGTPFDAVTPAKAARLRRLAGRWAAEHRVRAASVRVDVLSLVGGRQGFDLEHFEGVC